MIAFDQKGILGVRSNIFDECYKIRYMIHALIINMSIENINAIPSLWITNRDALVGSWERSR